MAGWRAAAAGWRAAVAGWRAAMISPRQWRPAEQACWQRLWPELFAGPAARRGPGHLLLQVWVLNNNVNLNWIDMSTAHMDFESIFVCLRNSILFVKKVNFLRIRIRDIGPGVSIRVRFHNRKISINSRHISVKWWIPLKHC